MKRRRRRAAGPSKRLVPGPLSKAARGLFDEAVDHQGAGRLDEAEALFLRVLALEPRHADSWNLLGVVHHARARYDAAIEAIGKALAIDPTVASYHSNLGAALHARGRLAEAIASYERALALNPDYAKGHFNLGAALQAQGKIGPATASYERSVALNPTDAATRNNLGNVLQIQGKLGNAVDQYRHALALAPDYCAAHFNLGETLYALTRYAEAGAHFARATALDPNFAEAHNNLGRTHYLQGKLEAAIASYERALAIAPNFTAALNNLGAAVRSRGDVEAAAALFERALVSDPDYAHAHYNRSLLKTFRAGDRDLELLESLATRAHRQPPDEAIHIHFALGKALDDTGEVHRGFEHTLKANALRRARVAFDEKATLSTMKRIAEVFDAGLFDRLGGEGDPSPVPIFVLGMPRSGSTLIEQILASHPQVQAGGELLGFDKIIQSRPGPRREWIAYPDYVPEMDGEALRDFARSYLAALPVLQEGKEHIVDKMTLNFLNVGMIRLVLPKAKIVHTLRDPLDTCLSCFVKFFPGGLDFTYDLGELGRFYRAYHELMAHWRSVLPAGAMLDVVYENVVDDLENEVRRLLHHCGLPWDERCLKFHETRRPVDTASALQVRQPLFRNSLQRWRRYEAFLGPLLAELGDLAPARAEALVP
jgi:tetratricopeptide (TPR) repeat protein